MNECKPDGGFARQMKHIASSVSVSVNKLLKYQHIKAHQHNSSKFPHLFISAMATRRGTIAFCSFVIVPTPFSKWSTPAGANLQQFDALYYFQSKSQRYNSNHLGSSQPTTT